jgi:hypothetical protein
MYHHGVWNLHHFMNKCFGTDLITDDFIILTKYYFLLLNIGKRYKSQISVLKIAQRGKEYQYEGQIKGKGKVCLCVSI